MKYYFVCKEDTVICDDGTVRFETALCFLSRREDSAKIAYDELALAAHCDSLWLGDCYGSPKTNNDVIVGIYVERIDGYPCFPVTVQNSEKGCKNWWNHHWKEYAMEGESKPNLQRKMYVDHDGYLFFINMKLDEKYHC